MDDVVNRFARELADAIAVAVAENQQVEACREKARAAGFEMKVTLEAVVGFVSRSQSQSAALAKVTAPVRPGTGTHDRPRASDWLLGGLVLVEMAALAYARLRGSFRRIRG